MYPDDATLIAALIARDQQAFRYAIEKYQSSMLSMARNIAGDKIADEVVQEAWMSVLKSLPTFERRSTLKTWLLRIVANEAKSRRRKEGRSISLEATFGDNADMASRFNDRGQWITGREPAEWGESSPEALMSRDELRDCIELVLTRLPEAQAATLRLREQAGYSFDEICNMLDVTESNVRVLLHRARSRLFSTIDHFQSTGECCEHP
ncbi:MAG: sigma-70 family RNA polymerase sigma factor [Pseudomonadales bacterium]